MSLDDANTALAVAYTNAERLAACEALAKAAENEAARLRTVIAGQPSLVDMWNAMTPADRAMATREINAGLRDGGAL